MFYRQLHFRSQPGSCLAILANGLETEGTLPAKVCLNDFSESELSFENKISKYSQQEQRKLEIATPKSEAQTEKMELLIKKNVYTSPTKDIIGISLTQNFPFASIFSIRDSYIE